MQELTYDRYGNRTKLTETKNGTVSETAYAYDKNNRRLTEKTGSQAQITYKEPYIRKLLALGLRLHAQQDHFAHGPRGQADPIRLIQMKFGLIIQAGKINPNMLMSIN